ncbi:uncharacterized protein LOC110981179 [Acanthaster planci]|uniref:Uncharacterized protein LOC110981179 n=1 Tax=Acanthaster planci TaxID=133434 RepID=A0A8B7YNH3_ACAPL|nr:uncharacterized protein LOC110981179 [Acanthaster planci]
MHKFPHAKVAFLSSLKVKHSKHGARSVIDKLIMGNIDRLTFHPESDDVLDIGCGTGYGSVLIGSRVRSVVGIETDASKLEVAKRDYPADNVTYVKVDSIEDLGENFNKWRNGFDKVVCLCALYFVPDVEAVLRNAFDCLKPGGESLVIMPHDDHNLFQGALDFMLKHEEWKAFLKGFNNPLCLWKRNEQETQEFFTAGGWSDVSCEVQRVNLIHNAERAKLILWDMMGHVDQVDAAKREKCLEDLWQWARGEYQHTEDGSIIKPADWMVIHARK